jgi:hypothetical protein
MPDLLTNIALKALKPAGDIRPRLRTRFEPSPTRIEPTPLPLRDLVSADANFQPRQLDQPAKPEGKPKAGTLTIPETKGNAVLEKMESKASRHPTIGPRKLEPTETPAAEGASPRQVKADATFLARQDAGPRVVIVPKVLPHGDSKTSSVHARKDTPEIQIKGQRREPDAIHITIGRVEVRAMVESSPRPQRQATKQTVMTLDEYLTRRAKGGSS